MDAAEFGDFRVRTMVSLKTPLLNNPKGTLGICYQIYDRPSKYPEPQLDIEVGKGYGFIFENGNYDGFSPMEFCELLEFEKNIFFQYEFTNVIELVNDFHKGIFIFDKFEMIL